MTAAPIVDNYAHDRLIARVAGDVVARRLRFDGETS